MRTRALAFLPALLLAFVVLAADNPSNTKLDAQQPSGSSPAICCTVNKADKPDKPAAQYFVEIYDLNKSDPRLIQQNIQLSATCLSPTTKEKISCAYATAGLPITLSYSSDSGLENITINATLAGTPVACLKAGPGSCVITPRIPGKVRVQASLAASAGFAAAPDMLLTIAVMAKEDFQKPPAVCAKLGGTPIALAQNRHFDAATVAALLGKPDPLSVVPKGNDALAIYSSKQIDGCTGSKDHKTCPELTALRNQIASILSHTADQLGGGRGSSDPFEVQISIPHATALGDLSKKIGDLNPKYTVTAVGSDAVRISAPETPDCKHWQQFLQNVTHLVWQIHPESAVAKLFFLTNPELQSALKGSGPAATLPAEPSVNAVGTDLMIFEDSNPGDDEAILEKKRLIASLDLPRPEMIISSWILQNSSTDSRFAGNFNDLVQEIVSQNNDNLQAGIDGAWRYLKSSIAKDPAYFDSLFYGYISKRYVGNNQPAKDDPYESALKKWSDLTMQDSERESLGYCPSAKYCLGYDSVFEPLKPSLMDLLLALIASNNPQHRADCASYHFENPALIDTYCPADSEQTPEKPPAHNNPGLQRDLQKALDIHSGDLSRDSNCEIQDLRSLVSFSLSPKSYVRLSCFREAADAIFSQRGADTAIAQPTELGLLRAAVADFLFNWKLSQQYPHEYAPYHLTRSADNLNSALRPFVDAFNRDIRAYQRFLGARITVEVTAFNKLHKSKIPLFKDKPYFVNNGIVTVRTVSGEKTSVSATSQSFMDASSAPQVNDLLKAIAGNAPGSAAPSGIAAHLSGTEAQLIASALSSYQSSSVQIGRDLSMEVTPKSLSGAVSAEITATLHAGESASPSYFSGPQAGGNADISRVAAHNTSTRIRVDSVKIFEVSSFTAVLQRPRSRFPLLPPFVEIPYIGTIVGVPLPPGTEYHSSTALISANIIPTAADLALGLAFEADRLVEPLETPDTSEQPCIWIGDAAAQKKPPCKLRHAVSLFDLNQPVLAFHRAMITCLTNGGRTPVYTAGAANQSGSCQALNLHNLVGE